MRIILEEFRDHKYIFATCIIGITKLREIFAFDPDLFQLGIN